MSTFVANGVVLLDAAAAVGTAAQYLIQKKESKVEMLSEKLMATNDPLEAFGNAKTVNNVRIVVLLTCLPCLYRLPRFLRCLGCLHNFCCVHCCHCLHCRHCRHCRHCPPPELQLPSAIATAFLGANARRATRPSD
eukprot:SAG11_NODE_15924_length_562_cov_1.434125_2_plen_135_part_01